MPNRLAGAPSPYLRQHADNPVHWQSWDDEAWAEARERQVPVFLSVGYSSCHWCHVMAHESFEDPEVGQALNRHFVSIKVDREERPDVDEAYMTAVQLATGHGGWPMSVFLTPDKKPFFAGTYFPRQGRGEVPGFLNIVTSLARAWNDQRGEVLATAEEFAAGIRQVRERSLPAPEGTSLVHLLDRGVDAVATAFDTQFGGFGPAPKFPPHASFGFLMNYASQRENLDGALEATARAEQAGHMALFTLERIALGGIHDHVGGGFHRYSTDTEWLVPHFEKMLYDNAQLLESFTLGSEAAREPRLRELFRRTALGIVAWVEREMVSEEGLFFSALDADSEGEEGRFYVWADKEVREACRSDTDAFCAAYRIVAEGNYVDEATRRRTGLNILHLRDDDGGAFSVQLAALRESRDRRVRPGLDDKCLAAWNGLMIGALARAGRTDMARRAAEAWRARTVGGELPHQVSGGHSGGRGFLDDYVSMAQGYLDLADASHDDAWRDEAARLMDEAAHRFRTAAGAYTFSSPEHEVLFGPTVPVMDQAVPSPNGVAVLNLQRLRRWEEASATLQACLGWADRLPRAAQTVLLAALRHATGQPAMAPPTATSPGVVSAHLVPEVIRIDADGWAHAEVVLDIPIGLHINSHSPPANWLTPTSIRVKGVLGEAGFPEPENDRYEGVVRIPLRLRPTGNPQEFELTVRFQACTETECRSPQEAVLTGVILEPIGAE